MLPSRLLSGTLVSALGRVVGSGISIVTMGVITRSLAAREGVGAYGSFAAVFAFLGIVSTLADGGLYLTFTRWASRVSARAESPLLRRMIVVRLVMLVLTLSGLLVVMGFTERFPSVVRWGVVLGSWGIAAQLLTQLSLGVFQKRLRMFAPAVCEVLGRMTTLLLAIVVSQRGATVLSYVGAFVGGAGMTFVGNLLATRRILSRDSALREDRGDTDREGTRPVPSAREILTETWPVGLLLVCSFIVFRADSLLLFYLRPPEDLGWYSLPYKVLESLLFFPAMMGGLLFPVFAKSAVLWGYRGRGERQEQSGLRTALTEATTLYLILAFPAVVTLYLGAPWTMHVLGGSAFQPSVPVMEILAVALGALFFGNLYGNAAIALGAQRVLLGTAAILAVVNVSTNLLVIPRYSFTGAAWTTLGTEMLSALFAGWIVGRRTGRFFPVSAHWHVLSAGGVLLLVALLPLSLPVRILLGLAAYGTSLWLLGVVTPGEIRRILETQRQTASLVPAAVVRSAER